MGLDPGLRRTGWGVVVVDGARLSHVAHGVIAPRDTLPFAERLLFLFEAITEVIALHAPDEAAVEETFVTANGSSTLKLGHARAAAMIAPARRRKPAGGRIRGQGGQRRRWSALAPRTRPRSPS